MKRFVALVFMALLAACGPAPKRTVEVGVPEDQVTRSYADSLAAKGHYLAFKKAFGLYRGLYAKRPAGPGVAAAYVRTGLLLALRERQMGIDNPGALAEVDKVIAADRSLAWFAEPALIVSAIPPRTRGVMKDLSTENWNQAARDRLRAAEDELRSRSASDELSAAVLAAWGCSAGRFSEKWRDPAESRKVFPDSLLLKYEAAVCGQPDTALLGEILAAEPEFAEAHYHLGEAAVAERRLFEAERHLLEAYKAVPESPQPRLLLAGIYFATEEFEASLEYYDLALAVSPEYRDALLGKAISLAYLERHDESMRVLDRMIGLGFWLLGEAHYWLAWNLRELERFPEALGHIDESKSRLQTNPHVFGLAGAIGLAVGELGRAEQDLLESVKLDPADPEPFAGLGSVYSRQARWVPAGEHFERAARAWDAQQAALALAIEDLKAAPVAPERKARLVRRRAARLERARFESAANDYSAAAAFFNGGESPRALEAAGRAAGHPALKDKAGELIRSIRK